MSERRSVHIWPDGYEAHDIAEFTISSGDLPIREYHCRDRVLTGRNRVNGSRDGGLYFPAGFFTGKTVYLHGDEAAAVRDLLYTIDFRTWVTEERVFELFGCEGFCASETFSCVLYDGKRFEYIGLRGETPAEFGELFGMLDKKCPGPSFVPSHEPKKRLFKVLCPACGRPIRPDGAFCGACGAPLAETEHPVLTMEEVDPDETIRRCRYCGEDTSYHDAFCRRCGKKM